jgi:hypothetical protein
VGWWAGDSIIGAVYRLCVWKLQTLPHPLHGRLGVWASGFENWNVKTKPSPCASTPSLPKAADPSLSRWWCFLETDKWGPMAWPGDNSHETASVCQHTKEGSHPAGTNNREFRTVALPAVSSNKSSVADAGKKRPPSVRGNATMQGKSPAEIPLDCC